MHARRFRILFFVAFSFFATPAAVFPQVQRGLIVETVPANSAAGKAGIQQGDRLLAYDGKLLATPAALQAAEDNTVAKDGVIVRVQRGDETLTLPVAALKLGIQVRPDLSPAVLTIYEEGRAAQAAKKTSETIARWTGAAKAAQEEGDSYSAAWLYGRVGEIRETERQWKEASEAHLAARKLLENSSDLAAVARSLFALGRSTRGANDFSGAWVWFDQAAEVDMAAGNEMWAANDLNDLGNVAVSRGDLPAAHKYHERALIIRERLAPESLVVAASLHNLGTVAWNRGDLVIAQDYFSRALATYQRLAANSLSIASILTNLGNVASSSGDLAAAQDYHSRALALQQALAPNSSTMAIILNNLGNVARLRNDLAAAQDYFSRSLTIRERLSPDSLDVAFSFNNLGLVAQARGDLATAQDYFKRALSIRERLAPDSLPVAASLSGLGSVARSVNDLAGAEDYFRRSLSIRERLAPHSMAVATSLNSLGNIAYERSELDAAQEYFNRAVAIQERLAPNSLDIAWSLNRLGRVAFKHRRVSDARSFFTRAVTIIEDQRWKIRSTEERALLLAQQTEPYIGLAGAYIALNDMPAAFATAERLRARSLLEVINERQAEIRLGADPVLLEQEMRLHQELNAKANRLNGLLGGGQGNNQTVEVQNELDALLLQYRDIQTQIRLKTPHYAALTQPQPLDLEGIQQQVLDDNTLLLEYALGDEISFLFAVARNSIRVFELPKRSAIEKSARRVVELLMARQPARGETPPQRQARIKRADTEYPTAARELSRMVLGPLAGLLTGQRLLIVADGALQLIPFGALPLPAGDASSFMINNHEIVSLPSASVLAVQRRELRGRRPAPKQVAVLADPVFDLQDPRLKVVRQGGAGPVPAVTVPAEIQQAVRNAGIADDRGTLSRLPFTREEADAIVALAPAGQGIKAVDFNANRATATTAGLGEYRIVHLATHGLVDTERPELSGIVLSLVDQQGKPQDGFLRLHDVYNLNWSAELVVLSACQTALGKEIRGEGLMGLARGFMYAGAKGVVASLWNVNDSGTAFFMKRFYEGMFVKGLAPAASLRAAQLEMSKRNLWRSPYYWAAFGFQGEWR